MSKITVNKLRKDGKVTVTFSYEGGANAFGGFYPCKVFNKIKTPEYIQNCLDRNHSIDFTNYTNINFIQNRDETAIQNAKYKEEMKLAEKQAEDILNSINQEDTDYEEQAMIANLQANGGC